MWACGAGFWGGVFILGEGVWREVTMERHLWGGVGVSTADCVRLVVWSFGVWMPAEPGRSLQPQHDEPTETQPDQHD